MYSGIMHCLSYFQSVSLRNTLTSSLYKQEDTIMNVVKLLFVLTATVLVSACANSGARTDYYLAVQQSAQAQAAQSEARYRALATIANSGDAASKAVATMAIAMSKDATIAPQYIESQALSWAKVLATPVATLGGLWIQSDVAKNSSNNARDIQLASFQTNEAIQLGQQNMVSNLGSTWASGAAASGQQLVDLGVAGFGALNTAGDQTVSLGTAGLTTAGDIATVGMDNLNEMGQFGMTAVSATGIAGMQNITDVSKWGMEGIWLTAENGMDGMQALGEAGMTNLVTLGSQGFTDLTTLGTHGIDAVGTLGTHGIDAVGTTGTTGMNLLGDQGTNYSTIIANMQATINQLGADLADPITCSQNADGLFVCQ
jgi:hypothetical protein